MIERKTKTSEKIDQKQNSNGSSLFDLDHIDIICETQISNEGRFFRCFNSVLSSMKEQNYLHVMNFLHGSIVLVGMSID